MDTLSDNALMLKVAQGDLDKMGLLFERYHRPLFGFLFQMTKQKEPSEDMVQNVFFRMLKYRKTFIGHGEFKTWMYHVARNVLYDYLKKNKVTNPHYDLSDLEDSFDITAKEENNNISVHNNDINKPIDLSLKIPQDVKLKLSTVNDGEIEVDNVNGELEINNVNGEIKLTNISGSVVATTVNGDLKTTFTAVDSKAPMAFTTLNGNVDVTFPATAKSNLKMKSDRGEIYTDFDIDIDKTTPKVEKSSQSGMYQLKLEDWVIGKINGGGPEVFMKNMSGNIYVRKTK